MIVQNFHMVNLNSEKLKNRTYEWFSIGILTVEIKIYLGMNSNFLYPKNMKRINPLNPNINLPTWCDDIGFDEKSIKKISMVK